MTVHIATGAEVYTAEDEHVGAVDRVVVDPLTRDVSHLVVRKGILFREDRVIPIEAVERAGEERIDLASDVDESTLPPFEEEQYVPFPMEAYARETEARWTNPIAYYGPYAASTALYPAATRTVVERNIPERAVALEAGADVVADDGQKVGSFEELLTTETGAPTHIIVGTGALTSSRKAIPIGWVDSLSSAEVRIAAPSSTIEAIDDYETTI